MTREEKIKNIESLKNKANQLKKEVDYYNALQLALKLVLNGSYGAFATSYFILYNNHVAGTITAQGRDLTKTMDTVNEDYWYNQWQHDYELHNLLCIKNITPINKNEQVSIYADTDSLFVSFKPAIDHCDWNNLLFDRNYLSSLDEKFIILTSNEMSTSNSNCVGIANNVSELEELIKNDYDLLLIDGHFVKDRKFNKMVDGTGLMKQT
jgi:DNA polymerase elongation subunit (family B)